jgi:hypothetical protein
MIRAAFSSTPGEFAALSLFPQAFGVKGNLRRPKKSARHASVKLQSGVENQLWILQGK